MCKPRSFFSAWVIGSYIHLVSSPNCQGFRRVSVYFHEEFYELGGSLAVRLYHTPKGTPHPFRPLEKVDAWERWMLLRMLTWCANEILLLELPHRRFMTCRSFRSLQETQAFPRIYKWHKRSAYLFSLLVLSTSLAHALSLQPIFFLFH